MKPIRAIRSDGGTLVINDSEKANILNKYFASIGEKLASDLNNQPTMSTVELIDRISPTVLEIEIEEDSVKENLSRLNVHKATGP